MPTVRRSAAGGCRAVAAFGALLTAACGNGLDLPPVLPEEQLTCVDAGADGGGCEAPGSVDYDAGPPCLPLWKPTSTRDQPIYGRVVIVDNPSVPVDGPPWILAETKPLDKGTVRVEIEKTVCGLATTKTKPGGEFELEGATGGELPFLRMVPVDRDDLVTTMTLFVPTTERIDYPIFTRAALEGLFKSGGSTSKPSRERGNIVVKFVDIGPFPGPLEEAHIDVAPGEVTYDSGGSGSGSDGLGMVLNAETIDYPGERLEGKEFKVSYGVNTPQNPPIVLAKDAVTFVLVGYH